jgi:hypothetical protein
MFSNTTVNDSEYEYNPDIYERLLIQNRYIDWTTRQLKIEYEIKNSLNQFNEFRQINQIYNE